MNEGREITVGMGEFAIAEGTGGRLRMNLGSCVAVVLFDPEVKVAGALHAMLPEAPPRAVLPSRYVDTGVPLLLRAMVRAGAKRERLKAKVIGGANMFPKLARAFVAHLGQRNAEAARRMLDEQVIPVVGEDSGGTKGRTLTIDADDGSVVVRIGDARRVV